MKLKQLLKYFNFLLIDENGKKDTDTIRIITDYPAGWFEFGMDNERNPNDYIRKDIMNRKVSNFGTKNGFLEIVLKDEE